jgi:hypothetical protein
MFTTGMGGGDLESSIRVGEVGGFEESAHARGLSARLTRLTRLERSAVWQHHTVPPDDANGFPRFR